MLKRFTIISTFILIIVAISGWIIELPYVYKIQHAPVYVHLLGSDYLNTKELYTYIMTGTGIWNWESRINCISESGCLQVGDIVIILLLILGAILLCGILYIGVWLVLYYRTSNQKNSAYTQLARMDLLTISLWWHHEDRHWIHLVASLFSMYQRGLIHINRMYASPAYRRYPLNPGYTLCMDKTTKDNSVFRADERYLLKWLFKENEGQRFVLDSLFGPDSIASEQHNKQSIRWKKNSLKKWRKWTKRLGFKHQFLLYMNPSNFVRAAVILSTFILVSLLFWMTNIHVIPNLFTKMVTIWIIFQALIALLLSDKHFSLAVYVFMASLCSVVLLGFNELSLLLLLIHLSMMLGHSILRYKQTGALTRTVAQWRHFMIHGGYANRNDSEFLEKILQASIILGTAEEFISTHSILHSYRNTSSILSRPLTTARIVKYTLNQLEPAPRQIFGQKPNRSTNHCHSGTSSDYYSSSTYNDNTEYYTTCDSDKVDCSVDYSDSSSES
ncbi:hypothetical protein AR543_04300 [Paenibacillus bovis]|uniref:Uncharacterized protein n=1 Tax=Paenibacillus bovis TaxID=1616788 RepID=A0A172ZD83_9BACL|nr:hypothetical protein AR543_04300 [Paenibacillus bovis]